MERYGVYSIFLSLLLVSVVLAVDKTREDGARGSGVVEAVVDLLRERCTISDDNFFLRRMAYAASRDGEKSDTYRQGFHGGIWQIDQQKFRLTQTTYYLRKHRIGIQGNFSINWPSVTWSDLRKPLYSGIAAALYVQYVLERYRTTIPSTVNAQALFWVKQFGGQRNDFLAVNNLRQVSCDTKPVDLVFVVDESGSIGSSNFKKMKNFLVNLVDQVTISNTAFHVGLVKFHSSATTVFDLNRYSQKSSVKRAIQYVGYASGGTRIGKGINKGRTVFDRSSRKDSTKVMILLTDGKSSDKTETSKEARKAKSEGVSIFVIGIGNVDREEITSAASEPTCVHVFMLQGFSGIDNILYEVRRRSCKAPKKVEVVGKNETKVEGDLNPDRVVEDTVEIDTKAQVTGITTNVTCGEVELFASAQTSSPNEAYYDVKGLARDNQPASFSIKNRGRTVFVHYKGKVITTMEYCKTVNKSFSITFNQAIDECEGSPCNNGATCVDLPKGFTCQCAAGYTGGTCQENIDECLNNPCVNGGQCIDIVNGYKCVCLDGYTGTSCEKVVNKCESSPCRNGGTCSRNGNDFNCDCAAGFTGKTCSTDINECQPSPCKNGGICTNQLNAYSCQCSGGFTGKNCDVNVDDCTPNPCRNGGSCSDLVNDFRCSCSNGYTGKACDVIVNHCQPTSCENGGSCINSPSGFSCDCQTGYTGSNCENEAVVVTCQIGSKIRECSMEDLKKSNLADKICTGTNQQNSGVVLNSTPKPQAPSSESNSSKCIPKGFVYHIPYPGDKKKFIQCDAFGGSTIMPCGPGTQFNKDQQICMATTTVTCPSTGFDKLAHPSNSGKYYDCVYGVPHLRSCAGGLVFNENIKTCSWPTSRRQLTEDSDVTESDNDEDDVGDDEENNDDDNEDAMESELNEVEERKTTDNDDKQSRGNLEKLKEVLRNLLDDEE
ncbi:uncharacterized protein LOC134261927 [Saccostrea cucullata]|uniref:uncharacterized protein LOC134261927 n=1 Tax=Saccostrea cuccullata TaxID=36930 RepID=UPI002ED464BD